MVEKVNDWQISSYCGTGETCVATRFPDLESENDVIDVVDTAIESSDKLQFSAQTWDSLAACIGSAAIDQERHNVQNPIQKLAITASLSTSYAYIAKQARLDNIRY